MEFALPVRAWAAVNLGCPTRSWAYSLNIMLDIGSARLFIQLLTLQSWCPLTPSMPPGKISAAGDPEPVLLLPEKC